MCLLISKEVNNELETAINISVMDIYETIQSKDVEQLLDAAEKTNENPRYSRAQFMKYFPIPKKPKSKWIGLFEADEDGSNKTLCALAFLQCAPLACTCVAMVQSFKKGSGKKLLNYLTENTRHIWLSVDPSQEDTLKKYYKKILKPAGWYEATIKIEDGSRQSFFLKAEEMHEEFIIRYIKKRSADGRIRCNKPSVAQAE